MILPAVPFQVPLTDLDYPPSNQALNWSTHAVRVLEAQKRPDCRPRYHKSITIVPEKYELNLSYMLHVLSRVWKDNEVGIYGYTAYSASKFGLRGMAEALQQELIGDDIHVSLIFPPDTETPGFAEENKRRPQLTSIIAASSGAMKAEEVARKALKGIQSGGFIVPCNFEGVLLSIATAGLSPQRSFLMAFIEVVAASILRIAALCFQWNWYASIERWHTQK